VTFGYEPLDGGPELEDDLDAMLDRATDLEPAFLAIVDSFHAIEAKRFEDNGPGWEPLSEATITMTGSWARTNQNFDQILRDTGASYEAMTGGAGSYILMTPDSVEMGASGAAVPYLHWHQTGGTKLHASGAGWPPKRKVVDVGIEEAYEWGRIVIDFIVYGEVAGVLV
jgi:hypothetical protein